MSAVSSHAAVFLLRQRRRLVVLAALFGFAGVAALVGLMGLGIGAQGWNVFLESNTTESRIFWQLRVPRVLMGALAGGGLAAGGTLTQAVLRNPLASPFTLGISSGAAFGAALVIVGGGFSVWSMAGSAFFFAACTALAILGLAGLRDSRPETLILGGVAVMFLFSAATSLLQYLGTEQQVQAIVFWSFGNLGRVGWTEISLAAGMILLPLPLVLRLSWDFNSLAAGEECAAALGVSVARLRIIGIITASFMAAGAICFTGVIGFVGLVAPHVARFCLGNEHRFLLPGAMAFGAGLVMLSDAAARALLAPQVIPIGIVTAFLGVPFFFWLLLRHRQTTGGSR